MNRDVQMKRLLVASHDVLGRGNCLRAEEWPSTSSYRAAEPKFSSEDCSRGTLRDETSYSRNCLSASKWLVIHSARPS